MNSRQVECAPSVFCLLHSIAAGLFLLKMTIEGSINFLVQKWSCFPYGSFIALSPSEAELAHLRLCETPPREGGSFLPMPQSLLSPLSMDIAVFLRERLFISEAEKQPGDPAVLTSVGKVTSAQPGLEFICLSLSRRDFVYRPFGYVPPERSNCL